MKRVSAAKIIEMLRLVGILHSAGHAPNSNDIVSYMRNSTLRISMSTNSRFSLRSVFACDHWIVIGQCELVYNVEVINKYGKIDIIIYYLYLLFIVCALIRDSMYTIAERNAI
jgi:hypothetical protein